MGKSKDLGHLAHIVTYDTENHITVPAGITMHTNQLVASQAWVTTALGSYALSTSLGSYVPTSRTITINGTTYDLSANRSWDITSMIYPAAGIPLSTGSAWGTSITNNSANWNTAYGWGNHTSAGYLTGITSTLITNALGFTPYNNTNPAGYITGITSSNVTTALGFTPVTNARTITINGTTWDLSANRSWTITATETDTLATVMARGASTASGITFTAPGGTVLLKHAVSEVDAWIFQENAANWGIYWKNNPSGNHTFGGYTTIGAETFGMSASNASGNGVLTSNFVGATGAYAQWMLSNYTGYIWSASTIFAAGDMRAPIYYDSNDTGYYLDPNSTSNLYKFSGATLSRNNLNRMHTNSPWDTRANQSAPYQNGTMGWGNIDFNVLTNWGSGFTDTWSNPGNAPGGSSHYVGMQSMHHSSENGYNFYGWQMTCAGEANNKFFWRSSWNTPRSWVEMIHSGNIGSQSVSYANSAGSSSSATSATNTVYINTQFLGSGSVSTSEGRCMSLRTDSGAGAAVNYAPVLHMAASDTMWQMQGTYGGSGNGTLYFRQGYAGSWGNWLTMISSANIGSQTVSTANNLSGFDKTNPSFSAVYASNWFRGQGDCGLYSQDYGGHIRRTVNAAHGTWEVFGYNKGSYAGINIQDPQGYYNNYMHEGGNGGLYSQNYRGDWVWYHNAGANCTAFNGSSSDAGVRFRVNGSMRVTGDFNPQGYTGFGGNVEWPNGYTQYHGTNTAYNWRDWGGWGGYWWSRNGGDMIMNLYALYSVTGSISDIRYKKDVEALPYGLNEIMQLNPIKYHYDLPKESMLANDPDYFLGFSAQEVQSLIPEAVHEKVGEDVESLKGMLAITYDELIPVTVQAIKEQQVMIHNQNIRIQKLEALVTQLLNN